MDKNNTDKLSKPEVSEFKLFQKIEDTISKLWGQALHFTLCKLKNKNR